MVEKSESKMVSAWRPGEGKEGMSDPVYAVASVRRRKKEAFEARKVLSA